MPVRVFITQGTTADCTQASTLIEGISALADRGYDSDDIISQACEQGIEAVTAAAQKQKIATAL